MFPTFFDFFNLFRLCSSAQVDLSGKKSIFKKKKIEFFEKNRFFSKNIHFFRKHRFFSKKSISVLKHRFFSEQDHMSARKQSKQVETIEKSRKTMEKIEKNMKKLKKVENTSKTTDFHVFTSPHQCTVCFTPTKKQ